VRRALLAVRSQSNHKLMPMRREHSVGRRARRLDQACIPGRD
jgi:hypothetical protein